MIRNLSLILLLIIVSGCSKTILIEFIGNESEGYYFYGKQNPRNFFHDIEISDSLELEFISDTKGSFPGSSVIYVKDIYLIADQAGRVYSFADTSGKRLGLLKHKGEIAISPVIVNQYMLFVLNNNNEDNATLFSYNLTTGEYINELMIEGNCTNEMIVEDETVIMLTQNGKIYSVSSIGKLNWEIETGYITFSDPVKIDNKLLFASAKGQIVVVNLDTKEITDEIELSTGFESTPLVHENVLYIGDNEGIFYAYSLSSKELLWQRQLIGKILSEPVADTYGNIYSNTLAGHLYSININDGELNWHYESRGVFNTPAVVFRNIVIQSDLNKKVLLLDKNNGTLMRTLEFDKRIVNHPVYHRNRLYIGVDRGEIYRYIVNLL